MPGPVLGAEGSAVRKRVSASLHGLRKPPPWPDARQGPDVEISEGGGLTWTECRACACGQRACARNAPAALRAAHTGGGGRGGRGRLAVGVQNTGFAPVLCTHCCVIFQTDDCKAACAPPNMQYVTKLMTNLIIILPVVTVF